MQAFKIRRNAKIYPDLESSTKQTGEKTLLIGPPGNSSGIVHASELIPISEKVGAESEDDFGIGKPVKVAKTIAVFRVVPESVPSSEAFSTGRGKGVFVFTKRGDAIEFQQASGGKIVTTTLAPHDQMRIGDVDIELIHKHDFAKDDPEVFANAGDSELYEAGTQLFVRNGALFGKAVGTLARRKQRDANPYRVAAGEHGGQFTTKEMAGSGAKRGGSQASTQWRIISKSQTGMVRVVGTVGNVSPGFTESVQRQLQSAPKEMRAALDKARENALLLVDNTQTFNREVASTIGYPGKIKDYVCGIYGPKDAKVGAFVFVESCMKKTDENEQRSIVIHEMAHALDMNVLHVSDTKEAKQAFRNDLAYANDAFKKGDDEIKGLIVGYAHYFDDPLEAFAEAAARLIAPETIRSAMDQKNFEILFRDTTAVVDRALTTAGIPHFSGVGAE